MNDDIRREYEAALDHDKLTTAIAAAVNERAELRATAEHCGGNIFCVLIPSDIPGATWYFGMANETWGGSLLMEDGDTPDYVETDVPSDSDNVHAIADAIVAAMGEAIWRHDAIVARMKKEITQDIAGGDVPATVTSFVDLHEYVDANLYGGFGEVSCPFNPASEDDANRMNAATQTVDEWLQRGRV